MSFKLPVQYVNRPHSDFRGFCGTIASGEVKVGDSLRVLPSNKTSKVKSIITQNMTTSNEAYYPMAITLTIEDEIDISRGDVLVSQDSDIEMAKDINVMLVWMDESPISLNSVYIIKRATSEINGIFKSIKYKKDVNTLDNLSVNTLNLNDIAECRLSLDKEILIDSYLNNKTLGSFIVIDKYSNNTVAAGMFLSSCTTNIIPHKHLLQREDRSRLKGHKSFIVWFTGLSGSGKSTIANALEGKTQHFK